VEFELDPDAPNPLGKLGKLTQKYDDILRKLSFKSEAREEA